MRLHNVHSRAIDAPIEVVGPLIDRLGGDDDPLWPADRWPATPLVLDGPLEPGTTSHQGIIPATRVRQVVAEHEPGRRLVFRFAPGLGLVGTHRLEATPNGAGRSRLTHVLDCAVEARMLPAYPILVRQHDALVEDLLDRAELAATGRIARPARWPPTVRIANAVEVAVARRRGLLPPRPRRRLVPAAGARPPPPSPPWRPCTPPGRSAGGGPRTTTGGSPSGS